MIRTLTGTGTQIATTGIGAAGQMASQAIATGAIMASTAWIPVIGAAVIGVSLWLNSIAKKNAQKTASTHIADEIEQQLKANVEGYLSGPRTPESQAWALQNFDSAWAYVVSPEGCGNPQLGSAGERCISERRQGARPQWDACQPNCPNWFELYRDPIADTPGTGGAAALSGGGSNSALWQLAAVLALVVLL